MRQTVPLGRMAGIRIGMHWSVLVMVILIGWLLGAQVLPAMTPHQLAVAYWAVAVPCAAAFMAALPAHELAHSPLARRSRGAGGVAFPGRPGFWPAPRAQGLALARGPRRYGGPVTSITLWALGGVAELGSEPPTARADSRIAAAGPATSLAAGLISGGRGG